MLKAPNQFHYTTLPWVKQEDDEHHSGEDRSWQKRGQSEDLQTALSALHHVRFLQGRIARTTSLTASIS